MVKEFINGQCKQTVQICRLVQASDVCIDINLIALRKAKTPVLAFLSAIGLNTHLHVTTDHKL